MDKGLIHIQDPNMEPVNRCQVQEEAHSDLLGSWCEGVKEIYPQFLPMPANHQPRLEEWCAVLAPLNLENPFAGENIGGLLPGHCSEGSCSFQTIELPDHGLKPFAGLVTTESLLPRLWCWYLAAFVPGLAPGYLLEAGMVELRKVCQPVVAAPRDSVGGLGGEMPWSLRDLLTVDEDVTGAGTIGVLWLRGRCTAEEGSPRTMLGKPGFPITALVSGGVPVLGARSDACVVGDSFASESVVDSSPVGDPDGEEGDRGSE